MKGNMKQRLQSFFIGRYGVDDLGRFLNVMVLVLLAAGIFISPYLTYVAMILLVFQYYRMLSKDMTKRAAENQTFLKIKSKGKVRIANLKTRFSQRKTHRFYLCPSCKKTVRIPKGKGNVMITCPTCREQFTRRS